MGKKSLIALSKIQMSLMQMEIHKSGNNTFMKYKYFELDDLLQAIIPLCHEEGVVPLFSFPENRATLKLINIEDDSDYVMNSVEMPQLEKIAKMNTPQTMGSYMKYFERYLLVGMFMIVDEPLLIDNTVTSQIENNTSNNRAKNSTADNIPQAILHVMKLLDGKGEEVSKENLQKNLNMGELSVEDRRACIRYLKNME